MTNQIPNPKSKAKAMLNSQFSMFNEFSIFNFQCSTNSQFSIFNQIPMINDQSKIQNPNDKVRSYLCHSGKSRNTLRNLSGILKSVKPSKILDIFSSQKKFQNDKKKITISINPFKSALISVLSIQNCF